MKKLLQLFMLAVLFLPFALKAQTSLNEGFDGTVWPPENWTATHVSGTVSWERYTSNTHNGSAACASVNWASAGHENYLITPQLAPVAGDTLSFFVSAQSYSGTTLTIEVSTVSTSPSDFTTVLETYTTSSSGTIGTTSLSTYVEKKIALDNYAGQQIYIAFHVVDNNGGRINIDDVTGPDMIMPSCFKVTNLIVDATQTTSNSLTLTWSDVRNIGATYTVYNGTDVVAANINDTTYTVTGLDANTEYTFGVVANCSATDESDIMIISGRTACAAMSLPWECGFETSEIQSTTSVTALPWCSYRYTSSATYGTNYPYSYSSNPRTGTRSLYVYGTTSDSYPDTMSFILPEVDVTAYPMNANRVTFWGKTDAATNEKTVYAYALTTPYNFSDAVLVDSVVVSGNTYAKYAVLLADAPATSPYVALMVKKSASYLYLDDMTFEVAPSCPDITGLTLDSQTASTASISWDDVAVNDYEVEVLQNNVPLTTVSVVITDTTAEISGLTVDNDYQIKVRAICGVENGAWSEALNVHIGYCIPNPTSVDGDGIVEVSFGGMTNTTHPTSAGFGDYTSMAGSLSAGLSASVDITYATGYTYGTIIWVDWNNSMSFDANEVVYRGTSASTNPTTLTATFDIPATTPLGNYRMRIAGADSYFDDCVSNPNITPDPCFTSSWAVAEDYTLTVTESPTCLPVQALTVSDVTANSATLTWNGEANGYTIYDMSDSSVVQTVSTTTANITNLTPMTAYVFGVAANCGSDESPIVTVELSTACVAADLPYIETFDSASATRNCWNLVSMNTGNDLGTTYGMGFYTYNDREVLRFSSYSSHGGSGDYNQYGFSPLVNVSSNATYLSVSVTYATYGNSDKLHFGYVTATDTIWDPTEYTTTGGTDWQTATFILPTTVTQLAVNYYGNYSYYAWIDSVAIVEMMGEYCYPVTNVVVDTVSSTSVTLSWTDENNTGITYTIYNMADTSVVASGIAATSYEITGLASLTGYTFGVEANCSATEASDMAIVNAVTACAGETCNITIEGADSFGDGWNGNAINVMQGGIVIGTFTLTTGSSLTETFSVCSDAPVSFSWVAGSYPGETSFQILDGGNTIVFTGAGSSMTDGAVFFTLNDACPTCITPAITVDNITTNSVTISWTNTADSYDIYQDGVFEANVTTNIYTFNGLTTATAFTFGVQAICSATDSSSMATVSVSTECEDVTVLPYNEGFENDLGCWSTINASSDGQPWFTYNCAGLSGTTPHGGGYVASSWSWNNSAMHANAWLISPKFVLPNTTDSLSFSWWEITNPLYQDSYSVVLSTTTKDTAAFTTVVYPYDTAAGTWTMRTIDLTPYAGQSIYIAFHHQDYDENYLLIDDISLYQGAYIPPAPDTLTVTFAVNDATMGTTVPAPGTYTYLSGDTVSFHPEANPGYHFTNWMIAAGGQTDTLAATYVSVYFLASSMMSYGSVTLTALFEADSTPTPPAQYTVILNTADATMGSVSPAGANTLFAGSNFTATANANDGYQFVAWMNGDTQVSQANPYTFTVNADITLTATFSAIPVEPCAVPTGLAVATNGLHNESIDVVWDNADVDGWNIQWRVANGTWASGHSTTNSYTISGLAVETTYEIQVQADCGDNNLSDWSASITATTTNVGVDSYLESSVSLYPNPAKEYVDIRVDGELNVTMMEVYDVYGKLINTVNVVENPTRINVSGLANGMYFVRVSTEDGVVTKTFVKK